MGRNSSSLSRPITTAALVLICLWAIKYGTALDKSSLFACCGRRWDCSRRRSQELGGKKELFEEWSGDGAQRYKKWRNREDDNGGEEEER